jgi:hypothetical protein
MYIFSDLGPLLTHLWFEPNELVCILYAWKFCDNDMYVSQYNGSLSVQHL